MKATMPALVSAFLVDPSPSAFDTDLAIRASLGVWSRVNNGGTVFGYVTDDGFGPKGYGHTVRFNVVDPRSALPRGTGLDIVEAYRDFVTKIWADIAAMERQLDADDAAHAARIAPAAE